jgi:hypothetical protein
MRCHIFWFFLKHDFISIEITNKMQPGNRIYYSIVHWRLNMFRAAYRSSSGALTVFAASGLRLDYGWSPHVYVNQRLQIQLELLMMSGKPLETCWAFNERWNNNFYYKVASCWLFLLNHTAIHGSMNIKYFWFLLPYLESVQTVVLCLFWLQCCRGLRRTKRDIIKKI